MVRCNLSMLMGKNRKNVQDVCNETGLARNTVSNLYYDRAARIDYNTIDKLCQMFHCKVGDLLEVAEEKTKV